MSTPDAKLQAAYGAWKTAENHYEAALAAVKSGSAEFDKDFIQDRIDAMIRLKNDFDLLDIDLPLPDQD